MERVESRRNPIAGCDDDLLLEMVEGGGGGGVRLKEVMKM